MPKLAADMSRRRFGRLLVTGRAGSDRHRSALWACACDCGKTTRRRGDELRSGHTSSCGCLQRQTRRWNALRRNARRRWLASATLRRSPEFRAWQTMKYRWSRLHRVHEEWTHDFWAFFDHVGPRPSPRHCLHLIKRWDDYKPGNVCWLPRKDTVAPILRWKTRGHWKPATR
jgi:hypothetical protein